VERDHHLLQKKIHVVITVIFFVVRQKKLPFEGIFCDNVPYRIRLHLLQIFWFGLSLFLLSICFLFYCTSFLLMVCLSLLCLFFECLKFQTAGCMPSEDCKQTKTNTPNNLFGIDIPSHHFVCMVLLSVL